MVNDPWAQYFDPDRTGDGPGREGNNGMILWFNEDTGDGNAALKWDSKEMYLNPALPESIRNMAELRFWNDDGQPWFELSHMVRRVCCGSETLPTTTTTTTTTTTGPTTTSPDSLPPKSDPTNDPPVTISRPDNPQVGKCLGYGDPHFYQFDHLPTRRLFDFYGYGNYWIVKSADVWIQGHYGPRNRARPRKGNMLKLAVGGAFINNNTMMLEAERQIHSQRLWWNTNQITTLPWTTSTNNGPVTIGATAISSTHMTFQFPHDVNVTVWLGRKNRKGNDGNIKLEISMRQIENQDGHCGNFNGNNEDDTTSELRSRGLLNRIPDESLEALIPYEYPF
jgi:hypothetical protein